MEMRKFKKELAALDLIYSFLEHFCERMEVPHHILLPVFLATEELFTNMVRHGPESTENVTIQLDRTPA